MEEIRDIPLEHLSRAQNIIKLEKDLEDLINQYNQLDRLINIEKAKLNDSLSKETVDRYFRVEYDSKNYLYIVGK